MVGAQAGPAPHWQGPARRVGSGAFEEDQAGGCGLRSSDRGFSFVLGARAITGEGCSDETSRRPRRNFRTSCLTLVNSRYALRSESWWRGQSLGPHRASGSGVPYPFANHST